MKILDLLRAVNQEVRAAVGDARLATYMKEHGIAGLNDMQVGIYDSQQGFIPLKVVSFITLHNGRIILGLDTDKEQYKHNSFLAKPEKIL